MKLVALTKAYECIDYARIEHHSTKLRGEYVNYKHECVWRNVSSLKRYAQLYLLCFCMYVLVLPIMQSVFRVAVRGRARGAQAGRPLSRSFLTRSEITTSICITMLVTPYSLPATFTGHAVVSQRTRHLFFLTHNLSSDKFHWH